MQSVRDLIVAVLVPCLLMTGCRSASHPENLSEYRPGMPAIEQTTPDSKVYVLLRLPAAAPATQPTSGKHAVIKIAPVEVERVYASRGSPIGFSQVEGQLIAVAGATEKPLVDARYSWQQVRRNPTDNGLHPRKIDDALKTAACGVVVGVAIVGLLWLIHDSRHPLSSGVFSSH